MIFNGFQKLTLLDFPGRVACTIFTGGCNMRCPFCHNALLVTELSGAGTFTEEEILSYLEKRIGVLDGVCITGGEPLMQPGLREFIIKVRELGYKIKLDTNGSYPDRLISLAEEGLIDYVAMDIKNSAEKYSLTTGTDTSTLPKIEKSIDFLLSGKVDCEFRTTVVQQFHTEEDIEKIAKRISGAPRYFLQKFVDSGNLIGKNLNEVPEKIMKNMQKIAQKYVKTTELRGI